MQNAIRNLQIVGAIDPVVRHSPLLWTWEPPVPSTLAHPAAAGWIRRNGSESINAGLAAANARAWANCYAALLELCYQGKTIASSRARVLHAHMIASGFKPRGHVLERLVDIYCKSSRLPYARRLFDEMPEQVTQPAIAARTSLISAYSASGNPELSFDIFGRTPFRFRDTVFYNSMITAFSQNKDGHSAVKLFCDMRRDGFSPDDYSFTSALAGLALIAERESDCQQLHCAVVKTGASLATAVSNALVSAYVKCVSSASVSASSLMAAARKLFDEMSERNEVSWTTMITGYVSNNDLGSARELFDQMDARLQVVWNAMISGYVHGGHFFEALELFSKMILARIQLDEFTYTAVLSACADGILFRQGREVHAYILRTHGHHAPDIPLPVSNSLVKLYWKCGRVSRSHEIFNRMPRRDDVSWNSMLSGYVNAGCIDEAKAFFEEMPNRTLLGWSVLISGCAQTGFGEDALKLYGQMRLEGLHVSDHVFSGAVSSCGALGALEPGIQLHAQAVSLGFESSLSAVNSLITMYAKCGLVEAARAMFIALPRVDSVAWSAMISALGLHGCAPEALKLYETMMKEGISPDRISFLIILSACSHAGLVDEGRRYFNSMSEIYGIIPDEEHYARFIDLLCRSGNFSEAEDVIESMPIKPGVSIWESLLSGCRVHGNTELGVKAAGQIFELTPQKDGSYVLLSNLYAGAGRWDDAAKVRKLMRDRGIKKEPGCSWIEAERKVHVFLADDAQHPDVEAVYRYLQQLGLKMRGLGYVPDTTHALHDVELEQKEHAMSVHSEKLAVGFGLLKLPPGAMVRVFKNLRICGDCHNAFEAMSKVVEREIVVRDGRRFHHFKGGKCSCGNYW